MDLQIEEVTVNCGSLLGGTKLAETESRFSSASRFLRAGGELKFHPKSSQMISVRDAAVALDTSAELAVLEKLDAMTS